MGNDVRTITAIIGNSTDPKFSGKLHDLAHLDRVEYLILDREDTLRHRLRAKTDKGTDCAVALSRSSNLKNGSVLHLDGNGAIVVRMVEESWLNMKPTNSGNAMELGYFVGNLHWRVRFDGEILSIGQDGPLSFYLERLQPFLDSGKAEIISDG